MDNNKKSSLINILALLELAATIALMSLGIMKGFLTSSQSNIVVGIGLVLFWIISDIIEPFACDRFRDISLGRKECYVKYIGLDLLGYAGILYFLSGVGGGGGQSSGFLGAVVFVATMKPKRDNMQKFQGIIPEEDEEEIEEELEETDSAKAEEISSEE